MHEWRVVRGEWLVASLLSIVVAGGFSHAQTPTQTKLEQNAIARAKNIPISKLEPGMPNVSLEYFLQTEVGKGAKFKWEMNDCGLQDGDPAERNIIDPPTCVEADVEPADGGTLTVMIGVGSAKTGIKGKPTVAYISFVDVDGKKKTLRRLSQIPLELHGNSPGRHPVRDIDPTTKPAGGI